MEEPDSPLLLQSIGKEAVTALAETMKSVVDRELLATPLGLRSSTGELASRHLSAEAAVVRCTLDQDFAGKTLHIAVPVTDAVALAGLMMMTPDADIDTRRSAGKLEGEDLESFTEVGAMLCKALDGVLNKHVDGSVGATVNDVTLSDPSRDSGAIFGSGDVILMPFTIKIGTYPESTFAIILDRKTAETWNGGPVATENDPSKSHLMPGDVPFDEIPRADIVGNLAAYVTRSEIVDVVRRACRRVGLELQRHSRSEIPNPAAHRNQIVLIDIPSGEERRFDWARRLKGYENNTGVVLLLQHANKAQVLNGFLAKADQIAGWPLSEAVLSKKLQAVMGTVFGVPEDE